MTKRKSRVLFIAVVFLSYTTSKMIMSSVQISYFILYLASEKSFVKWFHLYGFLATTTQLPYHSCSNANVDVTFTLSTSNHSAYDWVSNCSLQKYNAFYHISGARRSSSTPCFVYRSVDNSTYHVDGILCSEIETCDYVTHTCTSIGSICAVDSYCSSHAICLPLATTNFCKKGNAKSIFWMYQHAFAALFQDKVRIVWIILLFWNKLISIYYIPNTITKFNYKCYSVSKNCLWSNNSLISLIPSN